MRFYLNDKEIINDVNNSNALKRRIKKVLTKSAFYRLSKKIIGEITLRTRIRKNVPRVSLEDYRKNIIEMNELCKKNKSVLLLISPLLNKESQDRRFEKIIIYRKELENIAKQYNIPLLTIEQLTEKSNISNAMFFSDSVHPNELGNIVLMEGLLDYFKKMNIKPR